MGFKHFLAFLVVRLALVGVVMALVIWLLLQPGYNSATLLVCIVLALLAAELWRFVSRTNRELALTTRSVSISTKRAPGSPSWAGPLLASSTRCATAGPARSPRCASSRR